MNTAQESTIQELVVKNMGNTTSTIYEWVGHSSVEPSLEFLVGDVSKHLALITPILVRTEQDSDGMYIVSDEEFGVYGVGPTKAGAREDYQESLAEYYQIIQSRAQENTGNSMFFRRLCRYISARHPWQENLTK